MGIIFNFDPVTGIVTFNAEDVVDKVIYKGTTVYDRNPAYVISEYETALTSDSVVPPPYDENGYNYNASAPEETVTIEIDMGASYMSYDYLEFDWDNEGSGNAYGDIEVWVNWNEDNPGVLKKVTIFKNELHASGSVKLPLYNGRDQQVTFHLSAKSLSSYRYYTSFTAFTMRNVRLTKNS